MKRLIFLVIALLIATVTTGCRSGSLFGSRGARCGVPTFRMPRAQAQPAPPAPAAPCTNGCSTSYSVAPADAYPSTPSWTTPIDGNAAVETMLDDGYSPVYAGKPIITGETVISPEIAPMPSAP